MITTIEKTVPLSGAPRPGEKTRIMEEKKEESNCVISVS
jgi:hypothetical protein